MDSYTFLKRKRKWKSGIFSCLNVFSLMELQDPFENKKGKKENFLNPPFVCIECLYDYYKCVDTINYEYLSI